MGTIFVDNLEPQSGTSLTLGASGDTIALASGASQTLAVMTPAFEAYNNGDQSISNATYTKMEADTERFDTNNNYASNRFTPTVAGKYFVYAKATLKLPDYTIYSHRLSIYKNGSGYMYSEGTINSNNTLAFPMSVYSTIDMNGSSDYVEIFGYLEKHSGSDGVFESDSPQSIFGAYRVIGA
jgi:hypothetical protein